MRFYSGIVVLLMLVMASCSTEVELNAPYKSTTIVYALLDPDPNFDNVSNALDTQWVKINKTFLGDGDNTAYATIRDSSEYDEEDFVTRVVQRFDGSGDWVEDYPLISKTVSNKSINGIFYAPEQTIYYFLPTSGLDANSTYKILLQFTDGREVSSSTNIINYGAFGWYSPQIGQTLSLATTTSSGVPNYQEDVQVKWYTPANAAIYTGTLRFHFTEITYTDASWTSVAATQEKYLDFDLGNFSQEVGEGTLVALEFDGVAFYNFVLNSLEKNPLIRRVIGTYVPGDKTRCFDLMLTMGNEELKTFIEVNTPSTGIIQERPIYSNITNGIGLFAARGTKRQINMPLVVTLNGNQQQFGNLKAFFHGDIIQLNFCDPNPGSEFACD